MEQAEGTVGMRLIISGMQVEQLGKTSGVFSGRNRQYGFRSSKRVSEGFGVINGEGNGTAHGIYGVAGSQTMTEVRDDGRQEGEG